MTKFRVHYRPQKWSNTTRVAVVEARTPDEARRQLTDAGWYVVKVKVEGNADVPLSTLISRTVDTRALAEHFNG